MIGQNSLNNVYRSIHFCNPRLAEIMREDFILVAMYGLSAEKGMGQGAAERLRRQAFNLPVIQQRVLENALTEMGYS